jgi:hypothetical protein
LNQTLIKSLRQAVQEMRAEAEQIASSAAALESFLNRGLLPVASEVPEPGKAKVKGSRTWTPAQRAAQGRRMRKAWKTGRFDHKKKAA